MREILAVFLFPKAFGLHLFCIGPDFGRNMFVFQCLTILALITAGTKDVDDLVILFLLFFAAQNEGVRGRKESETAGVDGVFFRRDAVEFPLNDRAEDFHRVQSQRDCGLESLGAEFLTIRISADGTRQFLIQRGDFRYFPKVFHFLILSKIECSAERRKTDTEIAEKLDHIRKRSERIVFF
jgi:hypothetical protein